jgi:cytoskeleton protein RodZ
VQRDLAPLLQQEKAPSAPAPERAVAPPAAPAVAPAAAPVVAEPPPIPVVVLELTGRSWIEVLDSTGAFKLNGIFDKGFRKPFEGEPPYRVSIGNYDAARLLVDGKAMDLLPHFNGRLVRLTLDPRESRAQ